MRHRKKGKILDRKRDQRRALLKNLCRSLIETGRIRTTLAKAKFLRPVIEKLITAGLKNDLTARRKLLSFLYNDQKLTKKILEEIAPRYKERKGGYTRIVKIGRRGGDGAEMAIIEFV